MPPEGLLLLIETPIASSRDIDQLRGIGLSSRARHSRYTGLGRKASSTADPPSAEPEAVASSLRKSGSVSGNDTAVAPDEITPLMDRLSLRPAGSLERVSSEHAAGQLNEVAAEEPCRVDEAVPPTAPPRKHAGRSHKRPTPVAANGMPWAAQAPRMFNVGCRMRVTPERVTRFQEELEDIDNASLAQLDHKYGVYQSANGEKSHGELWYTVNFIMDGDGWDVAPKKGRVYKFAVDTGDCSFWLFEKDFRQLERVQIPPQEAADGSNYRYTQRDWSNTTLDFQQRCRRHRTIPPSMMPLAEVGMLAYGDGGELRVKRWPSSADVDLQFKAPVWDWVNGQLAYSPNHRMRFARVLAEAVNAHVAGQSADGNLGLAVPGWRSPWLYAGSKDRATFFDVLNHDPETVPTPLCVTVRLLPPDEYQLARANKRVQSFLYFGVGSPCGLLLEFVEENIRIPEYTPRMYIYPDIREFDEFNWWSLQLLSMTLLEPLVECPNRAGTDPLQWMPQKITLGTPLPKGASTGVRVVFDNGSGCSVFPRTVLQAIWTQWFQNDLQLYPNGTTMLRHFRDFSNHDILFQFQDFHGSIVPFRCRAQEFLSSPWNPDDGFGGSLACFSEPRDDPAQNAAHVQPGVGREPYVLGLNFFWASILRLDGTHRGEKPVPGQAKPFMQLAPQRVLFEGFEVAGPWNLEIHPDLPPGMQAVLRDQPELQA